MTLATGLAIVFSTAAATFLRWLLPKIKVKPPLKSQVTKTQKPSGPWG